MIFRVKHAQTKSQIIGCTPTQEHVIGTQRRVFTKKGPLSSIYLVYTRYILVIVLQLNTFVPVSSPRPSWLPQTWTPCGSVAFWPQTDDQCEVGGAQMPKAKC